MPFPPPSSSTDSPSPSSSSLSSPSPQLAIVPVGVEAEQLHSSPSTPSSPLHEVSVKRSVRDGPFPAHPVLEKLDQVVMDMDGRHQWADEGDGEGPSSTSPKFPKGQEAGARSGVESSGRRTRLRPNLFILKRARRESMLRRLQLLARIFSCLFCLVAFSVMAADYDRGWALDSFYHYKEFRFCLAVNAIGFLYSGLQAFDLGYFSVTGKHLANVNPRHFFDFSIDQALSYLLISATSSAATLVEDWQMNWGKDKFPQMATACVAFTVVAFISFALSSVISFYTLSTHRSF